MQIWFWVGSMFLWVWTSIFVLQWCCILLYGFISVYYSQINEFVYTEWTFKKISVQNLLSLNIIVPWNSPDYYKTCSLEMRCQSRNTKVVYTMWCMLYFAQQIDKCQDNVVSFLYWHYKTHLVPSLSDPKCPTQSLLWNI